MPKPLARRGNLPSGRPDKKTTDWRWVMVQRFEKVVKVEDVDQIIQVAVSDAINGDKDERASARTWLAPFLFPKTQSADLEVNVEGGINQYVLNLPREQLEALADLDIESMTTIDAEVTDASSTQI